MWSENLLKLIKRINQVQNLMKNKRRKEKLLEKSKIIYNRDKHIPLANPLLEL